jgi:cell surface protein SprA
MTEKLNRRVTITFLPVISILVYCCLLIPFSLYGEEASKSYIGMQLPSPFDPRAQIVQEDRFLGIHKDGMRSPFLKQQITGLNRKAEIDSTGENISFTEKLNDLDFRLPNTQSMNGYAQQRRQRDLNSMWTRKTVTRLEDRSEYSSRRGGGLRIDIPVEIKSKTFQKIFGSGKVGLDVTGDINIRGGFRHEKREEVKTALTRGSDNNFKMEQTQRFKVQGHIGEKVTIGVDQDSERPFDFDNNIRLSYEGYEDEVIQSIEAGNITLSLPGTRFVTFGGKSNGLFGIKTAMTLGNLNLTAIASQEKGEKKKLSLKGGASEEGSRIRDYQYKKGSYYFLDDIYRENYWKLRSKETGELGADVRNIITDIELYKSEAGYQERYSESIRGWAIAKDNDPTWTISLQDTSINDADHYLGYFIRLEKNRDYFVHPELGYINMTVPLTDGQVLAVAYRDSSGRIQGDIAFNPDEENTVVLRLLKNQRPRPSDKIWNLEWKHVYSLGQRNISKDGFEAHIYYEPSSGDPQETYTFSDGTKMTWLQIFGLDRINESGEAKPDNLIDDLDNILNLADGEIWFPDIRPFDPVDPDFQKLLPESYREPIIYDTTSTAQSAINAASKFYIETTSKRQATEYSLGMNVIENSEVVTLNGTQLTRGTDYAIDYMSGRLRILNEQATDPSANLDITYESNQLFQIDKKTIMGARAEYGLWDESFIGATFLYLNERTLDQKIRVGKGPMRNMVWDVNTSLAFKPQFLTRVANFLPFVDTRAPSSIKFEGEYAEVIPNPNTRNNENTGDNDGVAYIDDFEAAKRITPIPVTQRSWMYASHPFDESGLDPAFARSKENIMRTRGKLVYYNPYYQYPIKSIWPNRDINANVAQRTNILTFEFTPSTDGEAYGYTVRDSWNGIQKALSAGYYNQTESKFLEVWVRGQVGRIHIDMGQISEDIIPNKIMDTEDKANSSGYRNGLLDDGEDIGIDGMSDNDPRAKAAGGDFWDIDRDGQKSDWEPYSEDNWAYNPEGKNEWEIDYSRVNGYEHNEDDNLGRHPDSEDMNGNGSVDLRNDYFSYTFTLGDNGEDAKYISGKSISNETGIDYGWRLYRLPLNAPEPTRRVVGNPDFSLIEYIRVWFDGFPSDTTTTIQIAEIDLVGSEWKELGVADKKYATKYALEGDSTIVITEVNTHDNPEYKPPPGVQGEVDRISRVIAKEQSLVLKINNLQPGDNAVIQKTFYDQQDYINYNTMKMFVYGKDISGSHIKQDSSSLEFFLRFGADMNNFYEIRRPVYEGWSKNNIEVDLIELSTIKLLDQYWDPVDSVFAKNVANGQRIVIRGKPALRNVRMLVAGVQNNGNGAFTGEVWMNELRLSDVKKDKGQAMRARLDVRWADLVTFNGEINKQDADFHNVATQYGDGNNQVSGNLNTSISVGKFLPAKLGLQVPVSLNYSKSEAMPKYIPGTDVQVSDRIPQAKKDSIRTVNEKKGFSVSLKIDSRSQNFFVKNILTKFRASYSKARSDGSNSRTRYSISDQESGSLDWGVTFGVNNYFRPFKWLDFFPLLRSLSETKLYYTPQSFTTQHSGTRSSNESETWTGVYSSNSSFNVTRNYSTGIKIFESLSADVNRSYTHDLRDIPRDSLIEQIKNGQLGLLTNVQQNFSVKYNPKLFSWFTPNINYTVSFRYGFNRQQTLAPRSVSLGKNVNVSGNLNIGALVKSIYNPGPKRNTGAPRTQPPPGSRQAPGQQNKGGGFSVLGTLASTFNIFQPINLSYGTRVNTSTYGLANIPKIDYQFGLTDNVGVPLEESISSGGAGGTSRNTSSRGDNTTFNASSGLSLGRNIKVSFKYDQSSNLNSSTQTTGQRSQSWVKISDFDTPFPSWTLRVSGLEQFYFLRPYLQSVSIEHGYAGTFSQSYNVENGIEKITKEDKDSQFRPLLGVSIRLKNSMSFNVRYQKSEQISLSTGFGVGATRNTTCDLQFTGQYSKRSDFRIPVWPFSKMRLKNNVDVSVTFSMGSNITEKSKGGGEFEVTAETRKWFFKPEMTYSFSDRVRGGAHFEVGQTKNKLIGDSSYKEFGIDVNISIRG